MNDLTNVLLGAVTLLFAGNIFFLKDIYNDFKAMKVRQSELFSQIEALKKEDETIKQRHKEKSEDVTKHFDEKIIGVKEQINNVGSNVRTVQQELKSFDPMKIEVAAMSKVMSEILRNVINRNPTPDSRA